MAFEGLDFRTGNSKFNFGNTVPQQNTVFTPTQAVNDFNAPSPAGPGAFDFGLGLGPNQYVGGDVGITDPSALNAGPSFWEGFAGTSTTPGYGNLAIGGALGIGQLFQGFEGLKLAKDSLKASKSQFRESTDIQKKQINTDIKERGEAKFLGRGGTGETAEEFFAANRFK